MKKSSQKKQKSKLKRDEIYIEKEKLVLKQMDWIKGISLRIDNENQELKKKKDALKENYDRCFLDNNEMKKYIK